MNINTIMITETLLKNHQAFFFHASRVMSEEREAVFQFINLTGIYVKAEPMNIFRLKVQISSPAALSSSLISRSLMATWKPLALSFDNTAPVWYKNTLIYNSPYCANCHLNSEKSSPRLFYIFFTQSVEAAVSRAVGCLMKDSVCSNHLDICRCFEARHCLLRASVHSRWSPRATSWPQLSGTSSRRTRRELFGGEESAPWKSMKTGGGICRRWVG